MFVLRISVLMVVASAGLGGCIQSDSDWGRPIEGDPATYEVREALAMIIQAYRAGDGRTVCGLMSGQARKQLETRGGGSCADTVRREQPAELRGPADPVFSAVVISGPRATARVSEDFRTGRPLIWQARLKLTFGRGWILDVAPPPPPPSA